MPVLMKGHVWKDHKHKLTYPVVVEEKVDEVRVHVRLVDGEVEYLSYDQKPLYNLGLFSQQFKDLMEYYDINELDCGFEGNGNFTDSKRWVRSSRGLPADLAANRSAYRFLLFDVPDRAGTYDLWRACLQEICEVAQDRYGLRMERPVDYICQNEDEVMAVYKQARERKVEGVMVKTLDHYYEKGKRIYGWLKLKPSLDECGRITAFIEAVAGKDQPHLNIRKGDKLGRAGAVTVVIPDGSTASPHGIPHDLGRDMLLNPNAYLGRVVEFKYMERDTQGGYRHPTFWRIRDDV